MFIDQNPLLAYVLLVPLGFLIGLFGSFTGLGGALLLTPVLALGFGLPYHTAIGSVAAQTIGMSVVAAIRHYRHGHLDLRLGVNYIIGSIPGAILGRRFLQWLNDVYGATVWLHAAFSILYVAVLVYCVVVAILRWKKESGRQRNGGKSIMRRGATIQLLTVWTAGMFSGCLAGLLAIGGGLVAVPVLGGLLGIPIPVAVGTSMLQMLFTTTTATVVSIGTTDLHVHVIGFLLLGAMPGAVVGPLLLHQVFKVPVES